MPLLSSTMMDKILQVYLIIILIGDKIATLVSAAGIKVESYWPKLFAKAVEGQDIASFFNFGSASSSGPAQQAPQEAKK